MNHPFAGFDSPNYTQAPNVFYDQLVKEIDTLAELKVTEIAIRMTFGFHRNSAPMSISFLEKAAGLEKRAVRDGVAAAILRGTLEVVKGPTPTESTVYGIRFSQPRNLKTEFANAQQKNNSAKPSEPAGAPLGGGSVEGPPSSDEPSSNDP